MFMLLMFLHIDTSHLSSHSETHFAFPVHQPSLKNILCSKLPLCRWTTDSITAEVKKQFVIYNKG